MQGLLPQNPQASCGIYILGMEYPTITLEEHFMGDHVLNALPESAIRIYEGMNTSWLAELQDISGDGSRIQAMDTGGVSIQVLSESAGSSSLGPEGLKADNDALSATAKAQTRFRAFAALPMKHPEAAAAELHRAVTELGFVGALIDAHLDDGRYYDAEEFWPVFAKAEELDVPIYVHPTAPVANVKETLYEGNYDEAVSIGLGISAFGWHVDTALSVLRLYGAGVFWKFPKLKIVIGHMGELLPFQLARIDEKMGQLWTNAETSFQEVWDRNIWLTTSGMFTLPPMACLLRNTKIDRIMYSVDYPYSKNEQGAEFLRELRSSGLVTEEQFQMIASKNAAQLLKIDI